MKQKKLFSIMCAILLFASLSPNCFAQTALNQGAKQIDLKSTEPGYIGVDEYLLKYGENNVKDGFKVAESKALGVDVAELEAKRLIDENGNQGKDLFEALTDGEFLGMKIISISDLPPYSTNLSFNLECDETLPEQSMVESNQENLNNVTPISPKSITSGSVLHYTNYDVYYYNTSPNSTELGYTYEPNAGSYMYKRSYSYDANYLCEMDVTFNNTQLKCGSQNNKMYVYLHATSSSRGLDFGLMAAPYSSDRNKGMYAFYRFSDQTNLTVEAFPKVSATTYNLTNKTMTLANKTVKFRLSIGNETAEMYMEKDGSCIYYLVADADNISSGSSSTLTFMEAVTCPADGVTSLTSGSYFKNIYLSNSKLYSYTNGTRQFKTQGPATYYTMICKPSKVSFSPSGNTETISINYN